jgi:hypothetical protein
LVKVLFSSLLQCICGLGPSAGVGTDGTPEEDEGDVRRGRVRFPSVELLGVAFGDRW